MRGCGSGASRGGKHYYGRARERGFPVLRHGLVLPGDYLIVMSRVIQDSAR
jgi:hypothetical protein